MLEVGDRYNPNAREHRYIEIPDWLKVRSEIDPIDKLLMAQFRSHLGANEYAWPFVEHLAESLGVSESSIKRSIRVLEQAGLIEVVSAEQRRHSMTKEDQAAVPTSGNIYFLLYTEWEREADIRRAQQNTKPSLRRQGLVPRVNVTSAQGSDCTPGTGHIVPRPEVNVTPLVNYSNESPQDEPTPGEETQKPDSLRSPAYDSSPLAGSSQHASEAQHAQHDPHASKIPDNSAERPSPPEPVSFAALREVEEQAKRKTLAAREAQQQKSLAKDQKVRNLASKGEGSNYDKARIMERVWRSGMAAYFSDLPKAQWQAKERGQVGQLLDRYSFDDVERTLKWALKNWYYLNDNYFGGKYEAPTLGMILKAHETVFAAASRQAALEPQPASRVKFADLEKLWLDNLREMNPDVPVAKGWNAAERSKVQSLVDSYDRDTVEALIVFVSTFWKSIKEMFFKGEGGMPSLDTLVRFHAQLVPRAVTSRKHIAVIKEYESYGSKFVRRPEELSKRYIEARKELRELGVIK